MLPESDFYDVWLEHYDSRLSHYWEERRIIPHFAEMFRGKDVLSFGSGIGLNEIQFVRAGARLTCADIVDTNLQVIERVAKLEGKELAGTIPMEDSAEQHFGGPYDFIYANGSLMTMPFGQQRQVLGNFKKALEPDGRIILMLYTWKFVEDTCGVDSPKEFALRSDPSVGDIHNPWSDWHDDEKLMQLAGDEMVISAKQFWNQGYFVWYGLDWVPNHSGPPTEILPMTKADYRDSVVYRPDLSGFQAAEARAAVSTNGALTIETTSNNFSYAAWSDIAIEPAEGDLELFVDADLHRGAFSVALLDVDKNSMVASRAITWQGRHFHLFPVPRGATAAPFRIVLSNFRQPEPDMSSFSVFDIALVRSRR